jgi:recombinational DNA repair protein RecT
MSRKTVLKQLIYRYGPMSVNEAKAIAGDDDGWDNPSAEQQRDELNSEQKPVFDVSQFTEAEEVADDEPSPFDQK